MKKTKKSKSTTTPKTKKPAPNAQQRVREIRQVTDAILDSVVTGGVRECCNHGGYER